MQNVSKRTLFLAQFSVLLAIEALFCFTLLGSIPLSPGVVATLSHVPVVIAAIALGTRGGALMGFFFGLFSFIVWSTQLVANPAAIWFTPLAHPFEGISGNALSLVICFVPRVLLGTFAALAYQGLLKLKVPVPVSLGIAGGLGALTNTLLVLTGAGLFFGKTTSTLYATDAMGLGVVFSALKVTFATNGVFECMVAVVAAIAVGETLHLINKTRKI